ncbi:MAG: N-acetylglucosamine-6-phosphate deacetylase [Lachnospiraceae bacterium]|nr:N-acetylglucosamine-6-phosphate deacetylase [Lachnospiraceae bacterium]
MKLDDIVYYGHDGRFHRGRIEAEKGRFMKVTDEGEAGGTGEGLFAIPGMIDLHLHGAAGCDVCDATQDALRKIAEYEAVNGVCAMAPATMTLPVPELEKILANAADFRDAQLSLDPGEGAFMADLAGINMEGPFISQKRKGAQNGEYIISINTETAKRLIEAGRGIVKFLGIAPEENPGFEDFIREMKGEVHISLAHTDTDYDTALQAFKAGADHVVHMFNAMAPFLHRSPGLIGAAASMAGLDIEIICDGIHVHPAAVRAAFNMMKDNHMILISDSMRAAGLPDGVYTLGGTRVKVTGKRAAMLSDPSVLAGSVSNLHDMLRTAVLEAGIPVADAVRAVTENPAKSLGIYADLGSIEEGKKADIVILDKNLEIRGVMKDGVWIRE